MFLKKRKVNGIYYWSLVESYRKDGKVKQRVIQNLGNTEKAYVMLQERHEYKGYLSDIVQYIDIRSPLIYFGGKSRLAKKLIDLFPEHKTYAEPFAGAGHVLIQKKPSAVEVYNDISSNAVNFFLVVRENPTRFYEAVESLPYSRELYEQWRDEPLPDDSFERAVRWFYINRSGMCGSYKGKTSIWRHGVTNNTASSYRTACDLIEPLSNRMRKVKIECKDFREIITKYDSIKTFFYVDPPYIGREFRYEGGFTQKDHIDLAELLNNIKGKAMVSYYDDPLLSQLYARWNRLEIDSYNYSRMVKQGESKTNATELVLMNYDGGHING